MGKPANFPTSSKWRALNCSECHWLMPGTYWVAPGWQVMGHRGANASGSIPLQIDAASLIAASVMAAPCALAMAKLVYPEVEESKFKGKASIRLAKG